MMQEMIFCKECLSKYKEENEMAMESNNRCDKCRTVLAEGELIRCESCWNDLVIKKDNEIRNLENKNSELERELEETKR